MIESGLWGRRGKRSKNKDILMAGLCARASQEPNVVVLGLISSSSILFILQLLNGNAR